MGELMLQQLGLIEKRNRRGELIKPVKHLREYWKDNNKYTAEFLKGRRKLYGVGSRSALNRFRRSLAYLRTQPIVPNVSIGRRRSSVKDRLNRFF